MKKKKNKVKEYLPLYLMMLPGLLYLLINNYLPMTGIILAFKKLNFSKEFWQARGQDWIILNFCSRQKMPGLLQEIHCYII